MPANNGEQPVQQTPANPTNHQPPIPDRLRQEPPTIYWDGQPLRNVTGWSLEALRRFNSPPTLFQYARTIVRLRQDDLDVFVEPLTIDAMRHHLDQAATFAESETDRQGNTFGIPGPPPLDFVRDLLAMAGWPQDVFPRLKGIVRCPFFTAGGELITEPGYNRKAGLWYHPGPDLMVSPVPAKPSAEEVKWAVSMFFDELFADFPFAGPSDKANALSITLTPFVRELITSPVPLALIEAPAAGTGKSLLVRCLAYPALGRFPAANPQPESDAEWRKVITAQLLNSPTYLWFDNLSGTLRSASLEAALTSDIWSDRELGATRILATRISCVWLATANNLQVSGDLHRRLMWLRLDAKLEHPEERDSNLFKHPELPRWLAEHRSELVHAALILIQAWIAENKPLGKQIMGSFESWAQTMGGILQVAGVEGFLADRANRRRGADEESLQWQAFCEAWWRLYADQVVGVRDLFDLVAANDLLPWIMTAETEAGRRQRLGRALTKVRDRCFGCYRITEAGQDNSNRKLYKLDVLPGQTPPEVPGDYNMPPDQSPANRVEPLRLRAPSGIGDEAADNEYEAHSPWSELCYTWWHSFGSEDVVGIVFTDLAARLGLVMGSTLEERQKMWLALLTWAADQTFDIFRVESTEELETWDGRRYSCYRLRVVKGATAPIRSNEGQGLLGSEAAPTTSMGSPHRFTAADFDAMVPTRP